MRSLDSMLSPGQKIRVFYNEGNVNNEIRHIRTIVDDEYIFYRVWKKFRWKYRAAHRYEFEYMYEEGRLS